MKNLLLLLALSVSVNLLAQKAPENCNDLPYARVDKKASLKNDVEDQIAKDLSGKLKKGDFEATFKSFVSCKGEVDKINYQSGNLDDDQQRWLLDILSKSRWTAAVLKDLYVTSTVFISVKIQNGQVTVSVY